MNSASTPDTPRIELVAPDSPSIEKIFSLYRAHSTTLGFLPRGAFQEFARDGQLLAALQTERVTGYLAYRLSGKEAVLVHLCVDEKARGLGIATALMKRLLSETSHTIAIRLSCREEYPANRMWPRFGFVCASERSGRGSDGARLLNWRRQNASDQPLLDALQIAKRRHRRTAVVDANVFYDFLESTERGEESKSLLADWLRSEIVLCVTAELKNEIARHADPATRDKNRVHLTHFETLEGSPDDVELWRTRVHSVLPPPASVSDESDRRQLAHAAAKRAEYFVTRDEVLLDYADQLRNPLGIEIVRPSELIAKLHAGSRPLEYAPAKLIGTCVKKVRPTDEKDCLVFQRYATGENKTTWLARCRLALSTPDRFSTYLLRVEGHPPKVLYSFYRPNSSELRITILRALSHPLSSTLIRRLIAEALFDAIREGRSQVICDDDNDPLIDSALEDLGFSRSGGKRKRVVVRGIDSINAAQEAIGRLGGRNPLELDDLPPQHWEQRFWPLKVRGAGIRSFIVPIQPYWASELFDTGLAEQGLFEPKTEVALALENVFYSASRLALPSGSRILWYVSGKGPQRVGQVRASSLCLGTVTGSARELFRKFSRLGIFAWRDILSAANNEAERNLRAYIFAYTERFEQPITWRQVQAKLIERRGKGNPLMGPTEIPEDLFLDIYRLGVGPNAAF